MPRRRVWSPDDEPFALSTDGSRPEGAALEALLETGDVVSIKPIPWGSNYSFAALLADGRGAECTAVYKPQRGEVPLWDFPNGTLYRREYCAYVAARALGFGFVPPTGIRDGPRGVGTFEVF